MKKLTLTEMMLSEATKGEYGHPAEKYPLLQRPDELNKIKKALKNPAVYEAVQAEIKDRYRMPDKEFGDEGEDPVSYYSLSEPAREIRYNKNKFKKVYGIDFDTVVSAVERQSRMRTPKYPENEDVQFSEKIREIKSELANLKPAAFSGDPEAKQKYYLLLKKLHRIEDQRRRNNDQYRRESEKRKSKEEQSKNRISSKTREHEEERSRNNPFHDLPSSVRNSPSSEEYKQAQQKIDEWEKSNPDKFSLSHLLSKHGYDKDLPDWEK